MIAAIFNKSKPINLVFAIAILTFGFVIVQFKTELLFEWPNVLHNLLELLVAIFSVLSIDFIVKKNTLSEQNSFVILFFSLFMYCFWSSTDTLNVMWSNMFVILALRKMISLKTQTNTTQKIFDASLWLCVAVLFHFWTVLFFVVLYMSIAFYASDYYKNWLVPLVSMFVVFAIVSGYEMAVNNTFYEFTDLVIVRALHDINAPVDIAIISFFALILVVSLFFLSASVKTKLQKNKMSYVVLLFALLIAIIILLLAPNKSVSMLLYGYFPLAVLFTVFFERLAKPQIQSLIIYFITIIAVSLCFLSV
ncbi:MAG: hypothetical protein ACPGRW_08525 [Flavobacteriaceae bacterium]